MDYKSIRNFLYILGFSLSIILISSCSYNKSINNTIPYDSFTVDLQEIVMDNYLFYLRFYARDEDSLFVLNFQYANEFDDSYVPRIIDFDFNIKDKSLNVVKPLFFTIDTSDMILHQKYLPIFANSQNFEDLSISPYKFLKFNILNQKKYNFQFKDNLPFYLELNVKIAFRDSIYKNTSIYLIE